MAPVVSIRRRAREDTRHRCLLVSTPALARSRARRKPRLPTSLGRRSTLREDYAAAAKQFKAAHDLDPDPVYLFNIAQAHRLAKQCKDAGDYYRRYLDAAKRAPNADAVKDYITEVDDCAKAQAPVIVAPPPAPPPVVEVTQPVVRDEPPRSNKRLVGYLVGVACRWSGGSLFAKQVSGCERPAASCPSPCNVGRREDEARARIDDKARVARSYDRTISGSREIAAACTGGDGRRTEARAVSIHSDEERRRRDVRFSSEISRAVRRCSAR